MTIGYRRSVLHMEDVPLEKIAAAHGTPVYCYSATRIEDNYNAYRRALSRVMPEEGFTICYACKANSNLAVLRLLQKQGAGADIVSGGELYRVLKAGIPPSKIVFSGVGKTEEEIETAVRADLFQINVESEHELEIISRIAKRLKKTARVSFRVNPNVDAKTHAKITTGKKENKFGVDILRAPALYARAAKLPGVEAVGVAVHIGSQLTSLAPFGRAYMRVAELVKSLRRQGHDISRVDLGGGLGITYRDETPPDLSLYALLIRDIILPLDVHVVIEPGRSIVGNAGVLLSRVVEVKEGRDKKFMIIDAAMNDLLRASLYGAYHQILPLRKSQRRALYDVVGPVCETGDTFLVDERLPVQKAGDLVAIMASGAYGAVMSSNYNTRPLAPEVLVRDDKFALIRAPQSVKDIVGNDRVPGWVA
jgi:diaminopimelate decarboxylase